MGRLRIVLLLTALAAVGLVGLPAAAQAPAPPSLRAGGPATVAGMSVLSGSLHDHSTDSDGDAPSSAIAQYVRTNADELGLDFFSLTEHSDFFPSSTGGPDPWGRSGRVAAANSVDGFSVLRGFEWTNDQENHLNVIGSRYWTSRFVTGDFAFNMAPFWEWLAADPAPAEDPTGAGVGLGGSDGIGQFNHPSSKGALNWDDYALNPGAARVMATIEIREGAAGWYWFALSRGWTLGPVQNADFHPWQASGLLANATPGAGCGRRPFYDCERSLVVAEENTPEAILEALKARRTAASERPDLWATLRGPGGVWMGSTVRASPGQEIDLTIDAGTGSDALASVTLVVDGVESDYTPTYFAPNGPCIPADPLRDPAPGCAQHLPSYELQRVRFTQTGGKATKKGPADSPPPGRSLAPVALSGTSASLTLPVTIPSTVSTRPDGRHFVYAIVTRADGSRVFTAPIFTDVNGPSVPPVIPEAPLPVLLLFPALAAVVGVAALGRRRRVRVPAR